MRQFFGVVVAGAVLILASSIARAAQPANGTLRLARAVLHDAAANEDAYHVLIPPDWKLDGQVTWHIDRPAAPAEVLLRVRNPRGHEQFIQLPDQILTWSPMLEQYVGVGHKNAGCEIRRPVRGPVEALQQVIIPRYRKEIRNYRIVGQEDLPRVAEAAREGIPGAATVKAARLRLEYTMDGPQWVEEELACVYVRVESPGGCVWGICHITSRRADKGQLDAQGPLFAMIAGSVQPELAWYDEMMRVKAILEQGFYTTQDQIMKRARIEREKSQFISKVSREAWQRQQATQDRVHADYDCKAIRGVEQRTNPFTNTTESVPHEYDHAWVNARGEYIFTNQAGMDPNVGSNAGWRRMEKQ